MALDIVGPASAPNSTTIRPTDTRTFGATDTWAKDCSSPTANDGTKIQAGWLNGWMGQLRNLIRGNGQTAGSADIVAQDNTDDSMALKAIQHLTQRGLMKYAADSSGSANTITVSLTPALAEYKAGIEVLVKIANTNTAATSININTLGNKAIKTIMGLDPAAGSLVAGAFAKLAYDGTNFQIISVLGTAAFSMPKATLALSAIASLPVNTFVSYGTTLSSSDSLAAVVSTNTFTLPAGTYMFTSPAVILCNAVTNNTNVAWRFRVTKNGAVAGEVDEVDSLTVGQNLSPYLNLVAVATVTASDVLAVQTNIGTTLPSDYSSGSASAGPMTITRLGP